MQSETLARDVGDSLLLKLRQQSGLPPRLSQMLKESSTTVSVDVESTAALLLMKRPLHGAITVGSEEQFASALQQRASSGHVIVFDAHAVVEVSVAVPRRVPAELDRHSILRLGVLGSGFFGKVSVETRVCFVLFHVAVECG